MGRKAISVVALLVGGVQGARVVTDQEFNGTMLEIGEGEDCFGACGAAGMCDECGIKQVGSLGSVCCRGSSKTESCFAAQGQVAKGYSAWKNGKDRECIKLVDQLNWKVFDPRDIAENIHQIPPAGTPGWEHYHDNMRGILWMDQPGFFGHSDVGMDSASPDSAAWFGDPGNMMDTTTISRSYFGVNDEKLTGNFYPQKVYSRRSFSWFNKPAAYAMVTKGWNTGFHYDFYWKDDFTHALIRPRFVSNAKEEASYGASLGNWLKTQAIAKLSNANLDMYLQDYEREECNDAEGEETSKLSFEAWKARQPESYEADAIATATADGKPTDAPAAVKYAWRKWIASCAMWDRRTAVAATGWMRYPAFQIVKPDGTRRYPYWNKYVEWAEQNWAPDAAEAVTNGIISSKIMQQDPKTVFVATGVDAFPAPR